MHSLRLSNALKSRANNLFKTKVRSFSSITLRDGKSMPLVGFGTYLSSSEEVKESCKLALKSGYKLIDSGESYGTESEVGYVLKEHYKENPNDSIFVTTKLWPGDKPGQVSYEDTIKKCNGSLKALGIPAIDLYIIHAPFAGPGGRLDQWKALVHLQETGKCNSIGVSNYSVKHLEEIKASGMPMPVANQLEIHPLCQHKDIVEYCQSEDITVIAYSSLAPLASWRVGQASGKSESDVKLNELIDTIAKNHGVSGAQVLLKWAVQQGFPVLPKSLLEDQILSNIDLFKFDLAAEEIDSLRSYDRNQPFAWPIGDPCLTP